MSQKPERHREGERMTLVIFGGLAFTMGADWLTQGLVGPGLVVLLVAAGFWFALWLDVQVHGDGR